MNPTLRTVGRVVGAGVLGVGLGLGLGFVASVLSETITPDPAPPTTTVSPVCDRYACVEGLATDPPLSYLTWQACAADADHLGVDPDDYCLLTG